MLHVLADCNGCAGVQSYSNTLRTVCSGRTTGLVCRDGENSRRFMDAFGLFQDFTDPEHLFLASASIDIRDDRCSLWFLSRREGGGCALLVGRRSSSMR